MVVELNMPLPASKMSGTDRANASPADVQDVTKAIVITDATHGMTGDAACGRIGHHAKASDAASSSTPTHGTSRSIDAFAAAPTTTGRMPIHGIAAGMPASNRTTSITPTTAMMTAASDAAPIFSGGTCAYNCSKPDAIVVANLPQAWVNGTCTTVCSPPADTCV